MSALAAPVHVVPLDGGRRWSIYRTGDREVSVIGSADAAIDRAIDMATRFEVDLYAHEPDGVRMIMFVGGGLDGRGRREAAAALRKYLDERKSRPVLSKEDAEDVRHAAEVIAEADVRNRRGRFTEALLRLADRIERLSS